eukprot:CAMPEP_0172761678 /NCGR_PEP_ID=MMETSP1074-20121228/172002_1 /TAXON_ID=2916 /ORGANISM="Ceratium fusus, Strain PA161109" /LENGTH=190 /DNA_ID=CAMNT_0013595933 /DNA_START=321 /DNA_END=889 /DNA_ORIENTATION=-
MKALALQEWCQQGGRQFTRFDYTGHGQSSGEFVQGTIGVWMQDTMDILEHVTQGPQVLVGASMGGWLALLVAMRAAKRVAGVVGVGAAPDFVLRISASLTQEQRSELEARGHFRRPSAYSPNQPHLITQKLLDEGPQHALLGAVGGQVEVRCPVRLLHGLQDPDVSWQVAVQLAECLATDDLQVQLLKAG